MEHRPPVPASSATHMHVQRQGKVVNIDVKVGNRLIQQQTPAPVPIPIQHARPQHIFQPASGDSVNYAKLPQHTLAKGVISESNYIDMSSTHSTPIQLPHHSLQYSVGSRSSAGEDSKGSSPRASIASTALPDHLRQSTSPSLISPRSSVSPGDSKHSSPRTSLTNLSNILYDRFPMPRQSTVVHGAVGQQGAVQIPVIHQHSLMSRFNESAPPPAPPPPYNASRLPSSPLAVHINQQRGSVQQANRLTPQHTPTFPGQSSATHSPQTALYKHVTPMGHVKLASTVNDMKITKLKGLHYDVVPPKKDGPTEAEKKLEALTQQLENDMGISTVPSHLVRKAADATIVEPPPPYPGLRHATHLNVIPQLVSNTNMTHVSPVSNSAAANGGLSATFMTQPSSVSSVTTYGGPTPTGAMTSMARVTQQQTALPAQQLLTSATTVPSTNAETKLDALTQELGKQMDSQTQGEYYGEYSAFSSLFDAMCASSESVLGMACFDFGLHHF